MRANAIVMWLARGLVIWRVYCPLTLSLAGPDFGINPLIDQWTAAKAGGTSHRHFCRVTVATLHTDRTLPVDRIPPLLLILFAYLRAVDHSNVLGNCVPFILPVHLPFIPFPSATGLTARTRLSFAEALGELMLWLVMMHRS